MFLYLSPDFCQQIYDSTSQLVVSAFDNVTTLDYFLPRSYKSSCATLRLCLSSQACSRGRLVSIQRMFSSMVS